MTAGTAAPAAAAASEIVVGCIVKVVGLVKAKALNGRYGMVRRADPQRPGRFEVDFESTEEAKLITATIRAENLVVQDGDEDEEHEEPPKAEAREAPPPAHGHAAAATAEDDRPLQVGDVVQVVGLVSANARHLNGQRGRLSSFNSTSCRWHVRMLEPGAGTKAFKPDNLARAADPAAAVDATPAAPAEAPAPVPAEPPSAAEDDRPLQVGDVVQVVGLVSANARHLNGHLGRLASFHSESCRWHVRMLEPGAGTKAFKADNLARAADPADAAGPPAAAQAPPASAPTAPVVGSIGGLAADYASDEEQQQQGEDAEGVTEEAAADGAQAEGDAYDDQEAYEEEEADEDEELEDYEGDGLQAGAQVRIQGLVSAAARHLNGLIGTLSLFDPSNGRWQVRLEGGDLKAFKPENIALEAPVVGEGHLDEEEKYLDGNAAMDIDVGAEDGGGADGADADYSHLDANELAAAALQAELNEDAEQLAKLNAAIERRKALGDAYSSGTSGSSRKIEEKVEVPAVAVGFVIGRGGERIRDISAECGARMTFNRDSDEAGHTRTMLIRGSETSVAKAKAKIQEAIDEGVAIYKGGGKGKGKRDFRKGGKGGKAFDRVGEGAGGNAGFEEGICKWYAAGFCRNRAHNGGCRNGLHSSEAAIKAEQDWVAQGPPAGTAGPLKDPSRPILLLLDLEGGGNRDGTDGEDEIIEVPVLSMDPVTGQEMGRFHRFARPGFWDRNAMDMRRRFPGECFNERTSSVPFTEVIAAMKAWICKLLGLDSPASLRGDSFLFVTCGNWDVKTAIPLQCNKPVPGTVDFPTQKLLFSRWSNLKDVFREHYRLPEDRAPTGMRGMLNRLRIPLAGQHHLGMDDVSNLAKILHRLIKESCKLEPTGFAKNLDAPPPMFGGKGKGKRKGKGKGKDKGGFQFGGGFGKDLGCKSFGGKGKGKAFGATSGDGFGKGCNAFGGVPFFPPPPPRPDGEGGGGFFKARSPAGPPQAAGANGRGRTGLPFGAEPKAGPKRLASDGSKDQADDADYDPFAEAPAPHVSGPKEAKPEDMAPHGAKRRRGGLGQFLRGAPMPGGVWDPDDGSETEGSEAGDAGGSLGSVARVPAASEAVAEPAASGDLEAAKEAAEEWDEVVDEPLGQASAVPLRPKNKPLPWQQQDSRLVGATAAAAAGAGALAGIFDDDAMLPSPEDPPPAAEEAGADEPPAKAPRLSSLFANLPAPRASAC